MAKKYGLQFEKVMDRDIAWNIWRNMEWKNIFWRDWIFWLYHEFTILIERIEIPIAFRLSISLGFAMVNKKRLIKISILQRKDVRRSKKR